LRILDLGDSINFIKNDRATRPPRLSEPTKGRRALSTACDGGQERYNKSAIQNPQSKMWREVK